MRFFTRKSSRKMRSRKGRKTRRKTRRMRGGEKYSEPILLSQLTDDDEFHNRAQLHNRGQEPKIWYKINQGDDGINYYLMIGKFVTKKNNQYYFDSGILGKNIFPENDKYTIGPLKGKPLQISYKIE